jgi:GR25 family glycosyltransferase involved in LPS biosynthesis
MKIGAIIIHSSNYIERKKYVDNLVKYFSETPIDINIIEGVITDQNLYDARFTDNISLKKGVIGCSLAHLNAMKLALDMNYDYVYIFEDDITIMNNNYNELQNWLNKLPQNYDLCQLTNVGSLEGIGHDGRIHKNIYVKDFKYVTCPFGTQAYYTNKNILRIMYDCQINHIKQSKIHIADGLLIHCEKKPNVFLNIITPQNTYRFFKHADIISIIGH